MRIILQKLFINYLHLLWFAIAIISFPLFTIAIALNRGLDFINEQSTNMLEQIKEVTNEQ